MNNRKHILIAALCLLFGAGTSQVVSETNKTSLLSNQSFESGMAEWNTLFVEANASARPSTMQFTTIRGMNMPRAL